jgi:hypothetical protein
MRLDPIIVKMLHISVKLLHIIIHNTSFQKIYLLNTLSNGA